LNQSQQYEYDYKLKKSPVPYITTGAFWLLWALIFPLYAWYHFLIVTVLSIGIYFITARIFPAKQIKVRREHKIKLSGDRETDELIKEARICIMRIEQSSSVIESINSSLAADSRILVDRGVKILDYIAVNPESSKLVRRFLNYYIPTLDKLLVSYIDFKKHNTAQVTCTEIEETVPEMKNVFQGQLDKLLSDRELDISTDIDVLESKLKQIDK